MISSASSFELIKYGKIDLQNCFSPRTGETKLGEVINNLQNPKYIILGVEESIGPRANKGQSGAENGFKTFLNSFLNMQSNESLRGDNILVLGKIVQKHEIQNDLSTKVEELDQFIFEVLEKYVSDSQIPIVIGGGHNNAFPLMKFSANKYSKAINVVNLDAHADYRQLEGRHSGNPFSYAFRHGHLNQYHVFGLHQRYNSQQILNDLRRDGHQFTFHEDYILEEKSYLHDFKSVINQMSSEENYLGIELDLDAIEHMPSSAFTPVGVPISIARQYLKVFAEYPKLAYLHLPEGAPKTDREDRIVGKTLAYFVSDFIITHG